MGRPALPSAHYVFKLKTKPCMSYVFPPSLFYGHTVYTCPATYFLVSVTSDELCRAVSLCLMTIFDVSSGEDQESHPVHTLFAISRFLPSTEGYQHLLILTGFFNSVISDRQERHSKCHKHNASVTGDCLFHLKYINLFPVL